MAGGGPFREWREARYAPRRAAEAALADRMRLAIPGKGTAAPPTSSDLELLVDPGHHVAEVLADLLDLVLGTLLAHVGEVLAAGAVLGDPLLGELA